MNFNREGMLIKKGMGTLGSQRRKKKEKNLGGPTNRRHEQRGFAIPRDGRKRN